MCCEHSDQPRYAKTASARLKSGKSEGHKGQTVKMGMRVARLADRKRQATEFLEEYISAVNQLLQSVCADLLFRNNSSYAQLYMLLVLLMFLLGTCL